MAGSRELAILVTARNMASGVLKDVRGDIRGIQSEAKRGLQQAGRNLAFIGGAAAVGLGALVVKSIKDASDLQQAGGAVDSVFGKSAATLHAWAETAAEAAGLSKREVLESGAVIGAQLQGMGFEASEAADRTVELEKRAADLAATFGGSTTEALESISSLLRGERDPIEKYGVSLKQADINAELAARGLDDLEGEQRKLAEATIAYDLLMRQTSKTQGQFTRESDSAAGAQARLQANLENTRSTIGTALLPQVSKLADRLNDAVVAHMPEIEAFAATLPGVFDDLLGIVERLPWGAIGDAMRLMGEGARAALNLFTSLPPWVQTAVLTGWGLNKLTGGALGNIVGALGSGLIKGVLGMNAGVVNINAATVTGGGGGGMLPTGGKGGGGFRGGLGRGLLTGGVVGGAAVATGIAAVEVVNFQNMRTEAMGGLQTTLDAMPRATSGQINEAIGKLEGEINAERPLLDGILFNTNVRPQLEAEIAELRELQQHNKQVERSASSRAADAKAATLHASSNQINEFRRASNEERTAINAQRATSERANTLIASQKQSLLAIEGVERGQSGTLTGILNKRSSVSVSVHTTANFVIQEWQRRAQRQAYANAEARYGGII